MNTRSESAESFDSNAEMPLDTSRIDRRDHGAAMNDAQGQSGFFINRDEASLLARLLGDHLGNLRMEIADTESYSMRENMKHDEQMIKELLRRFNGEELSKVEEEAEAVEIRELTEEGL